MNLLFLLFFGVFFSLIIFGYLKPDFVFPNSTCIYLKKGRIPISKRTAYFAFILFGFIFFLIFSSFQYINTDEYARWAGWSNDMTRYWFGFHDANGSPLGEFILAQGQEPLYTTFIWLMRKVTSHFSIVLLVVYTFIFFSCLTFLKDFISFRRYPLQDKYFYKQSLVFTVFSFFCLFYSFILLSFCLFRMGIAVSISLYTYRYLLKDKYLKAFIATIVACGFHFSSVFVFFVCGIYKIYQSKKFKISFFLLLFFMIFIIGMIGGKFVPVIMSVFAGGRYNAYAKSGIAINTYLTNFILLLMILYKRKEFFHAKQDSLSFVVLLSSFFILDLQLVLGIFYRMIMFTYPMTMLVIPRLWSIYKLKRKEMLLSLCARSFLFIYLAFFLYKFCVESWPAYGLTAYKLFYFY